MVGQTLTQCRPIEVRLASLQAAEVTLASLLNHPERERLDRIVAEADRGRFLLGAALLRQMVGAHLGIDPEKVEIDRDLHHLRRVARPTDGPRLGPAVSPSRTAEPSSP